MERVANRALALLRELPEADTMSVLIAGCVCFVVGLKFVQNNQRLQEIGRRIGFAALLGVFIYLGSLSSADEYFANAFKASFWAILITGVSWILLTVSAALYRFFIQKPGETLERWRVEREYRRRERRAAAELKAEQIRDAKRRRKLEEEEARREVQRAKDLERSKKTSQILEGENVRKRKVRAACERAYVLHEAEIKDRFKRSTFDDIMRKHLGDEHSPEYVEEQGKELLELIQLHRHKIEPPRKIKSLADAAAWFEEQKTQLELVSEDKLRRSLLVQLKQRYADLTTQMMDDIE
jgi:hypothetical protein